ncbi:MAG: transcription elongation factor GreA [Paludibacter sp.]|nr:transcription elongation factor GreA [Paludibacter sp.]
MVQYFTKEGLEKIKEELKFLKGDETKRVTKLISEAAAFGDLKENAAYHDARDKMAFLRGRIEQLESAINEAVVKEKTQTDKIEVGSDVVILFDGKKENYSIVAPTEADILKNKISYQSPLGKLLMNKKEGEQFDFISDYDKIKIKIVSVK